MLAFLDTLSNSRVGVLMLLTAAAGLEVWGDAFFKTAIWKAHGAERLGQCLLGGLMLVAYGIGVNLTKWSFGEQLGLYVAVFFVVSQVMAWIKFREMPSAPLLLGGGLIIVGGLVIGFTTRSRVLVSMET
jgi:small multidrug resistance family-3 protein